MKLPFVIVRRKEADWIKKKAYNSLLKWRDENGNQVSDNYAKVHIEVLRRVFLSMGGFEI